MQDEIAKLDAEIEARHAKELHELDAAAAAGSNTAAAPPAAAAGSKQAAAAADGSAAAAADKASRFLKTLSVEGEDEEEAAGGKGGKVSNVGCCCFRLLVFLLIFVCLLLSSAHAFSSKGATLLFVLPAYLCLSVHSTPNCLHVCLSTQPPIIHQQKPSKAQRRREKMAAKDAEREARIAAGENNAGRSCYHSAA